ncbi:MAG: hypothetical protein P8J33_10445 [Pirellulaceae bacterium]|nr:hypothetical protein [Pirellulaceae bacterium]
MNLLSPVLQKSFLIGLLIVCCVPLVAAAQKPIIMRVEAYPAEPFGVAKVTFRMGQSGKMIQNTGAVRIREKAGRIFYPAFSEGLLTVLFDRPRVGGVQSVWFLFRGDTPLDLTLYGTTPVDFVGEMSPYRPALARVLFNTWWRQFNAQSRRNLENGDYPPLVETYLAAMLENRLRLTPPPAEQFKRGQVDELEETMSLIFEVESLRSETIREMLTLPADTEMATQPVPAPPRWSSSTNAVPKQDIPTETLVRFVPEECFYLRFGSWNNQLWVKRLMEEYGGDLTRMISLRGHIAGDSTKLLDQLVLESNQVDDLFGGNLISDVAAIGTDLYLNDGPSNAILMLAKNKSLETRIRNRRKKYAKDHADEGVTFTELEIDGTLVTLLSTQDNRIRSFFAVKDLCHITSTSMTIVKRFLEASKGEGSLANNPEFQMARERMPLDRDDTVFVYLSRPFFENLLSPTYQIELMRRNQSIANMQMIQMAQWAAQNEGFAVDDIETLIANGFLPENFNRLPDGSSTHFVDGQWQDTLRGLRGFYKPIADMPIEAISPMEASWLQGRIQYYESELRELDPIVLALQRFERDKKTERIVIDGRIAPFGAEKYGWLGSALGSTLDWEIDTGPEALASLQVSVGANMLAKSGEDHLIFGVIQGDLPPKNNSKPSNFFEVMKLLKTTPGYVGAWPSAGYLELLPSLSAQADSEGFTYSRILGIWRMQQDDFSLAAFDRQRLQQAKQYIKAVPAEQSAQIRLRIGDISSSNLVEWANVFYFNRSWETSVANVQLLNMLIQQFNLPPDAVLADAEKLLGVKLACPLQGEYKLIALDDSRAEWQSTNWPSFADPQMPEDYMAPPIKWFRGVSLDAFQINSQFIVHGHIDVARDPANMGTGAGGILGNLPSIDLFKGFSKVEKTEKDSKPKQPARQKQKEKTP